VHERHLNTDILLALMRALLLQRPELRLILMSATINVNAYSDYFGAAPIIEVENFAIKTLFPNTLASFLQQSSCLWAKATCTSQGFCKMRGSAVTQKITHQSRQNSSTRCRLLIRVHYGF
jgi:HrpA-like RNA helicase